MEINFKYRRTYLITSYFIFMFSLVQMQELDLKCLQYKKQIFEETATFGYFIQDAEEETLTADHCSNVGGFVVGGENALPKEFAFAARLGNKNNSTVNWFCGGTLLSKNFVLTAAHCSYSPFGEINIVRLGELDFDSTTDDADPEDFGVQKIIEHSEYIFGEPYNDIALILLSSPVEFNRYKHPACLPVLNNAENSNNLIAIGWGNLKDTGQSSSHLQKVSLNPYSYSNCQWLADGREGRDLLPRGLLNSQLCAGSTEAKDTCQGDSGGPLLTQHTNYSCMYIVEGITSTGSGGCATPNTPALYTRVIFYIDWINFYIGSN